MSKCLQETIRTVPNWPIEGVMFRDITTLLQHPGGLRYVTDAFYERYKDEGVSKVAGIDARGFIFGALLAARLGVGFVPVRKKGKLPFGSIEESYDLEYGSAVLEVHSDAITAGEKVVIIDDLIATGGTVAAAARLVTRLGGEILELAFVIELPDLGGREKVPNHEIYALTQYAGE